MAGHSRSVLIVDDDPRICKLISRVAERESLEANLIVNSGACVNAVRDHRPDKIFLDLAMPGIDGIEVLRMLSSRNASAQICLMSGRSDGLLRSAHKLGQKLGLNMYAPLSKPLTIHAIEGFLQEKPPIEIDDRSYESKIPDRRDNVINTAFNLTREQADSEIARGISDHEILPFYQPIVCLKTGRLHSLEALCRWHHPDLGKIMPSAFLPHVVKTGQMDAMTIHLLGYTLDDMQCWESMGMTPNVSINLCPAALRDDMLVTMIIDRVKAAQIDPSRVCFEITEEDDCCASVDLIRNICRLRLAGFNLALDDFGTGYSSLEKLQSIPFSTLKIDRQFVAQLTTDVDARAIVKSAIALSEDMALTVVAEGVEDQHTSEWLLEQGCQMGQGFFYSRPQDFNEIIATIQQLNGWQSS